jgi:hypothetical protein
MTNGAARRDDAWSSVLTVAAGVNLAAGLWLSWLPSHAVDLLTLTRWTGVWLGGHDPYAEPGLAVDYPPWALVTLAPLAGVAALSETLLRVFWIAVNLAALAWLLRVLVRATGEPRAYAWRLACLLAACASARTLGQFSLVSWACAIAATVGPPGPPGPDRWSSGLLLGLALFKPQIGGVAWLWAACERRWRLVGTAILVPVVLLCVFAARVGHGPVAILGEYAVSLTAIYGGDTPFGGHTEITSWILMVWSGAASPVARTITLAVLLMPAVWAAGHARPDDPGGRFRLLALCGVASLLVVRHLSYDFILLFPALVAFRAPPVSASMPARFGRGVFLATAGLLVAEVPSLWRWFAPASAPTWLSGSVMALDRLVPLALWFALTVFAVLARHPQLKQAHRICP